LALEREQLLRRNAIEDPKWKTAVILLILYNLVTIPFRISFLVPWNKFFLFSDFFSFIMYLMDLYYTSEFEKEQDSKAEQERIVRKLLDKTEMLNIRKQFDLFDGDGDGHITLSELQKILQSMGEDTTNVTAVKTIMESVDLDQNGTIEFNEFCNVRIFSQKKLIF
jgi:hypothetical protein